MLANFLELMRQWVEQIITTLGYPGIGLVMFIENIFPPIPSEVVMPFAGFLVVEGQFSFVGVLLAGTVGALIGAVVIYWIGARLGEDRLRRWIQNKGKYLLLNEDDLDRAINIFDDHGNKMILIGRLIPGVRSLISLPAGLEAMALGEFLLYTTLGTAVWNVILAGAGLYLGHNWDQVLRVVDTYETVVWILLALLVSIFVFRRIRD